MSTDFADDFERRPLRRIGRYRPDQQERSQASLCHLLAIFTGFIGPLVIWSSHKDRSRFVDFHGRESLNFSVNILILSLIATVILTVIAVVTCGFGTLLFPLLFGINIYAIVCHVSMMNAANAGKWIRYGAMFQIIGPPEGLSGMPRRRRDLDDFDDAPDLPPPPPREETEEESGSGSTVWLWVIGVLTGVLVLCCLIGGGVAAYMVAKTNGTTSGTTHVALNNQPSGPAAKKDDTSPLPADPVERALIQLKSNDAYERRRGAETLSTIDSQHPRRADVLKALKDLYRQNDSIAGSAVARALIPWAGPGEVPELLELLDPKKMPSSIHRTAVVTKLGEFKDPRAIKPLAGAFRELSTRQAATEALKRFGSAAEDEVILVLKDNNILTRRVAIDLLKEIGTKKSLPALEELSQDRNPLTARQAKDAIEAIKARNP